MAAPTSSNGSSPKSVVPAEWPVHAADLIVETIAKVRDKTTRPALVAARALVYGLMALIIGTLALVVLLILVVRFANNYVPGHVWWVYLALGVIFTAVGLMALKKANAPLAADV
ncbi:MAG: hypothetical protein ABIP03_11710 [Aquihabitans sp.]